MGTKKSSKAKVGSDGLTKHQRFFRRNREVICAKNAARGREKRRESRGEISSLGASAQEDGPQPTSQASSKELHSAEGLLSLSSSRNDCYDGLNVHWYSNWNRFVRLKEQVEVWASADGGIDKWPAAFQDRMKQAKSEGPAKVRLSEQDICDLHDDGTQHLYMLKRLFNRKLPSYHLAICDLWKEYSDVLEVIVKGLTVVNLQIEQLKGENV